MNFRLRAARAFVRTPCACYISSTERSVEIESHDAILAADDSPAIKLPRAIHAHLYELCDQRDICTDLKFTQEAPCPFSPPARPRQCFKASI